MHKNEEGPLGLRILLLSTTHGDEDHLFQALMDAINVPLMALIAGNFELTQINW